MLVELEYQGSKYLHDFGPMHRHCSPYSIRQTKYLAMSDQSKKQQTKQSTQKGTQSSKTEKTSRKTQIGDSKKSIEHLRKAMEIPPKKTSGGKEKK